jgi:hypothetical protein
MQQITINYDAGLSDTFKTCREYIQHLVHNQGVPQKAIAADMDYSPSDLSRKLSQSPDDSRRFTLDDLEKFIEVTGDVNPVLYLVEKFVSKKDERDQLLRQIEELQERLKKSGRNP